MPPKPDLRPSAPLGTAADPALESALSAVESGLDALGDALRARDATAIDVQATALHLALQAAVDQFLVVARAGHVPPPLRHRLANASGQVAAQREALARATVALDRAIEVLMPPPEPSLYTALGGGRRRLGGMLQA